MWSDDWEGVYLALFLIDKALLFSKEEVIQVYENNKNAENLEELLYEKAIYPNGEKLGFYNTSKYTLKDVYKNRFSKEIFNEYFKGFSKEIIALFRIFDGNFDDLEQNFYFLGKPENYDDYVKCSEDLKNYFRNVFNRKMNVYFEYVNLNDYSNSLINILFDEMTIKDNISILEVNPNTAFLYSCVDYIINKNPDSKVELYAITTKSIVAFSLKFLSIISKIDFNFAIFEEDDEDEILPAKEVDFDKLFGHPQDFDFVVKSYLPEKFDNGQLKLSNFNIPASSRVLYISYHGETDFSKSWLEDDILESLILMPYKIKGRLTGPAYRIRRVLVTILNYQKNENRKNRFIVIDNNKNKDIVNTEYDNYAYINLVNSRNIYNNSFQQFKNFADSDFSKVFAIDEKLIKELSRYRKFFNINELMYETKMKSQKTFYKIEYVEGDELITENLDYDIEKLGKLLEEIPHVTINNELIYQENSLYLLMNDYSVDKWVFFHNEIDNPYFYQNVRLTSEKVILNYLYHYLNSQIGINEYEYFMRGYNLGLPRVEPFKQIRVPIPPIEIQEKIVESRKMSGDLFEEMNQLKNSINNNFFDYEKNIEVINKFYGKREYSEETQEILMPDNWLYTYRGLIWPLAISYLIATSGGFEKTEKANNLLRLFEFTTAFNAYVLISGIPEDVYERRKHKIWNYAYDRSNNDEKFKEELKLTFGSWFTFHYKLNDIYKKNFDTEINKEFYLKLVNEEIRELYEKTLNARNEEFHDGIVNAHEAQSFLNELESPKSQIFNYLNSCYKNIKLYYNFKSNNARKNGKIIIEHNVMFLNGPYSMPIYTTIEGDEMLEPETLYLHDVENNKFAKLDERLIKFEAMDENKRDWRLYVFVGFETDEDGNKKAKYRNYLRSKDIKKEYIDLNELM